jgi:hypothetical protein
MTKAMHRALSLSFVALAGCIGINPEWDEDPRASVESSSGDAADVASSESHGGESSGSSGSSTASTGHADASSSTTVEPPACEDPELVACAVEGEWSCVDPSHEREHCGGCSHDCATYGDASCEAGECTCDGNRQLCADQCVDAQRDPEACGEECVNCWERLGESAECKHGECELDD